MNIVPIRDLKDTVKIEKLCIESQEPVFVTKNGYGRLVVMDIDYFEKLMGKAREADIINQGVKDLDEKKIINGESVYKKLSKKYKL